MDVQTLYHYLVERPDKGGRCSSRCWHVQTGSIPSTGLVLFNPASGPISMATAEVALVALAFLVYFVEP